MEDSVRKLRGLLGIGTTWGVAWGLIGAITGIVIGMLAPWMTDWYYPVTQWALGMAAYGFVSGIGFGALLAIHERTRSVDELSPARAGITGVLGAVIVPVLFALLGLFEIGTSPADILEAMAATAVLGGTFAAGSVALARSAPRLEHGKDAAAVEPDDAPALLEAERTSEPSPRRSRARQTHER